MIVKYIIVDDEHIAHDIIKSYCDILPKMQLLKNCYDAIEAIEYLSEHSVDLIFLDLNMPQLKGFDFLKTLTDPPKVIVTTAYTEFALEGYVLDIVDYLLKPFSLERFLKAVNKAFKLAQTEKAISTPYAIRKEQPKQHLYIQANKKHYQIPFDDLVYIEAAGNYTKIVLHDETITVRETISNMKDRLPEDMFLQIHRSYIIALSKIRSINENKVHLKAQTLPIGKKFRPQLINALKR